MTTCGNIEMIEISKLRPSARNARTHSKKQIDQIARSITRFGFTNPVLTDDQLVVLAGHGRLEAARKLNMSEVPCRMLGSMSDVEKRAYVLADNKIALEAGWDFDILALELGELIDADFEVELTGFAPAEIDSILQQAEDSDVRKTDPADERIPATEAQAVTELGDLWVMGNHRLLCGDAKSRQALTELMQGELATMAFLDPPYNVPIAGHVSGLGRKSHREFAEASGEMRPDQFTGFLQQAFEQVEAACSSGAIVYACMDWRHAGEMLAAGHAVFSELKNVCVWDKTNAGMGTFYRSKHELVFVWKVGDAPHINTFGLGDTGRYRTNVWTYAGANSFRAGRQEDLAMHPTVKPVALVADAIRDVSRRGDIVIDTFGGSGTTLIAAQRTGRRARLVEIDPQYCDVILRRWQQATGKSAILVSSGESFEDVWISRSQPHAEVQAVA